MKTRRLNPDMIVSFEIHKEHKSERYKIRPEGIVPKFFGIVAEHQERMVVDTNYWAADTKEFQYPWDFLKANSDRYEIIDDIVMCKAEVKICFVDGQTAKFYFNDFAAAVAWTKALSLNKKLETWLQAAPQH